MDMNLMMENKLNTNHESRNSVTSICIEHCVKLYCIVLYCIVCVCSHIVSDLDIVFENN